jgi:hypothetical protein
MPLIVVVGQSVNLEPVPAWVHFDLSTTRVNILLLFYPEKLAQQVKKDV